MTIAAGRSRRNMRRGLGYAGCNDGVGRNVTGNATRQRVRARMIESPRHPRCKSGMAIIASAVIRSDRMGSRLALGVFRKVGAAMTRRARRRTD